MRRRWWLGGALALLLLVTTFWLTRSKPAASDAQRTSGSARSADSAAWHHSPPGTVTSSGDDDEGTALLHGLVVDASGHPVPGATVLVFDTLAPSALPTCASQRGTHAEQGECDWEESPDSLESWSQSQAEGDSPRASASTDGDGRFELPRGGGGALAIWARHGDAVGEAEVASGVNAVKVVLAQGAVIRGTVRDAKGHPLSGATVVAIHSQTHRMFPATTDSGGHFTTDPLPAGDFEVLASAPGFSPEVQTISGLSVSIELYFDLDRTSGISGWVARGADPVPGLTVHLDGAVHRTARTDDAGNFRFTEVPSGRYQVSCKDGDDSASDEIWVGAARANQHVELDLHPGGSVRGDVMGPDGAPVAARVELTSRNLPTQTVSTDSNGQFLLRAVPPGRWLARASAPSLAGPSMAVAVRMGQSATVHLTLGAAVSIRGRVLDPRGQPISGARLRTRGSTPRSCTSDSNGDFTLTGLEAGAQSVTADHPGWVSATRAIQAPSEGVEIRLSRGTAVHGTVLDPNGNPMEGIPVLARQRHHRIPAQQARSDAHGAFTLRGLADGEYLVTATTSQLDEGMSERTAGAKVELNGSEPPPVTLQFEDGVSLGGRVVDTSGQPVSDALVSAMIRRADGVPAGNHARSGLDGRFTIAHLEPVPVRLFAMKTGYETSMSTQATGGDQDVSVVLTPRPRVRGRLLDPDGAPVTRFRVGTQAVVAPDGRFEVPAPWFRKGQKSVALVIRAAGYAAIEREISADQPFTDLGDLRLGSGRTLDGVVVDARSGAPVAGAQVSGAVNAESWLWRVREPTDGVLTGADGRFSIPNVGPDTTRLRIRHPGYIEATVSTSTLSATGTIQLIPGAGLHGRVVDATGAPRESVVMVTGANSKRRSAVTLADGTYSIDGLPAGTYQVGLWSRDLHFPRRTVTLAEGQSLELDFRALPAGAAPSP